MKPWELQGRQGRRRTKGQQRQDNASWTAAISSFFAVITGRGDRMSGENVGQLPGRQGRKREERKECKAVTCSVVTRLPPDAFSALRKALARAPRGGGTRKVVGRYTVGTSTSKLVLYQKWTLPAATGNGQLGLSLLFLSCINMRCIIIPSRPSTPWATYPEQCSLILPQA